MVHRLPLRRAVLASGAVIGTAVAGVVFAVPASAGDAAPTIKLNGSELQIIGDAARNDFLIGSTTDGFITLNGVKVLNGAAALSNVTVVHVEGAGSDDTIKFDESNRHMPKGEFLGGDGNDQLVGGSATDTMLGGAGIDSFIGNAGNDTIVGDAGNDKAVGGTGDDTIRLGADSDQFTWNVGDGDDHADGDAGTDTLLFNGSNDADHIFTAVDTAPRATVGFFLFPFGKVDYAGFEQLKIETGGGEDIVSSEDLTGTGLSAVRLGLDPATPGGGDSVDVQLGDDSEQVRAIGSRTTGVTVSGMAVPVLMSGADNLNLIGGIGPDVIDASRVAAGTFAELDMSGYSNKVVNTAAHDVLIGSPGDDFMFSFDDGGDRMEGRGGNDELFGSSGDDELFGGDGDDFISGLGGNDVLDGGTGNNVIIR